MQTQVTCPQCGTPHVAEIYQVVDAKKNPVLKQRLLSGQLNVDVCPACGFAGQMATILLFHDPDHELFMVHVPPQMNLNEMQREQAIGQLTRQVMDQMPPEERRAYMFQPQLVLNMQTFLEKVLETEGITKEMIERQKKQSELLTTLIRTSDKDVINHLVKERVNEIDETFFAMLQSFIDQVSQMNDEKQLVKLVNLRAKLMVETPAGRRLEQQQIAMHKLNREAKAQGGLSPALLLAHIVANLGEQTIVDALVAAGQPAINYEFFSLMTDEIEKQTAQGETAAAKQLTELRDTLVAFQEKQRAESEQIVKESMQLLEKIMQAPDKAKALQENAERIDDAFMYVFSVRRDRAAQEGLEAELRALNEIESVLMQLAETQMPPQVQLLNQLMRANTTEAQEQLLEQYKPLLNQELLTFIDQVMEQAQGEGQDALNGRLQAVKQLIAARL